MGRKTYEAVKRHMVFQKNQLRIVMTSHPELYATQTIPHKLEFTDESPQELVMRVSKNGYKTMLLVGGGTLNTAFFKSKLVNELFLTIEPILFGDGISIVTKDCPDIRLQLLSIKRLNPRGTLLLRYRIE
jgi:dihydrofolate reductase